MDACAVGKLFGRAGDYFLQKWLGFGVALLMKMLQRFFVKFQLLLDSRINERFGYSLAMFFR